MIGQERTSLGGRGRGGAACSTIGQVAGARGSLWEVVAGLLHGITVINNTGFGLGKRPTILAAQTSCVALMKLAAASVIVRAVGKGGKGGKGKGESQWSRRGQGQPAPFAKLALQRGAVVLDRKETAYRSHGRCRELDEPGILEDEIQREPEYSFGGCWLVDLRTGKGGRKVEGVKKCNSMRLLSWCRDGERYLTSMGTKGGRRCCVAAVLLWVWFVEYSAVVNNMRWFVIVGQADVWSGRRIGATGRY